MINNESCLHVWFVADEWIVEASSRVEQSAAGLEPRHPARTTSLSPAVWGSVAALACTRTHGAQEYTSTVWSA